MKHSDYETQRQGSIFHIEQANYHLTMCTKEHCPDVSKRINSLIFDILFMLDLLAEYYKQDIWE